MYLKGDSFHQSTRAASDSQMVGMPMPSKSLLQSQKVVPPTATGSSSLEGSSRHEQKQYFCHEHHYGPILGSSSSQAHPSLQSNHAIPPRTNQYHSAVEDTRYFLYPHNDIYSQGVRHNDHADGRIGSRYHTEEHRYPMYQWHQFHDNSQGEPTFIWNQKRNTPSPTSHSVVTNVDTSSLQVSGHRSIVDHTYRDFSGVPPSKEDLQRYKNKKCEFIRKLKDKREKPSSDSSPYVDSRDLNGKRTSTKKRGRGIKHNKDGIGSFVGFMGTNFPARLHDLLSHENGVNDTITWLPHGRSWIVRDKAKFLEEVAPSHFQISKFESFTRQVNGWGFKRITQGPDINSYYHEMFLKGMPHLIQWMKRIPYSKSGTGKRKQCSESRDEPNFYDISAMYPIPNYYGENRRLSISGPRMTTPSVFEQERRPHCPSSGEIHRGESIAKITGKRPLSSIAINDDYNDKGLNGSLEYLAEGQSDIYLPFPKKLRSTRHHASADDFWTQSHRIPDKNYYHNSHQRLDGSPGPRIETKEAFLHTEKHTGLSKNHWQSFYDALSETEDGESEQFSNYQNKSDTPSSHIIESFDFEPHSLQDCILLDDSQPSYSNESYYQGWHNRHSAHYYGEDSS